ncbi:MAG: cyclic nucleotide-binding domain-containing protein [Treponema sp.]|jgi:CRP-like cAMP-binding protein|nr:cyclic nucleotide-binding domain-containing protein [Treponema sp.]
MITLQTLQKYSLFGGLLEDQIEKILPLMELESFKSGTDIMIEGSPNDKIYFIINGEVSVIKGGVVLSTLETGTTFGEMEVLDVMPSAATVRTLTDVTVMFFSNRTLREIFKRDAKTFSLIIMNLARDLSRRLRLMDDKAVEK